MVSKQDVDPAVDPAKTKNFVNVLGDAIVARIFSVSRSRYIDFCEHGLCIR
jgi:hypothetical protein